MTTDKPTKRPQDLEPGDIIRHRHRKLKVIRVEEGLYATFNIIVQVLTMDRINISYETEVELVKPASPPSQNDE